MTVTVSAQAQAAAHWQLTFVVQDTGIGIAPDRMTTLFQSFSQVDASVTRRFGGTGLGLVISKRLAEALGGTMWVESAPGRGTRFAFTIGARLADDDQTRPRADVTAVSNPARLRHLESGSDLGHLHDKHILLLTEHDTMQRLIQQHLHAWSVVLTTVTTFPTQQQVDGALLALDHFDAVIVDCAISTEGKARVMGRLLQYDIELPIVLLTMLGEHPAGQYPFVRLALVTKPLHASQLHDALVTVIYGKTAERLHHANLSIAEPAQVSAQPLRVLVAEDNLVNQQVALGFLSKLGYRADVAANGIEVLEAVERQPYDLILMDVNMPEMDGFMATQAIRSLSDEAQPYIVAMTANAMAEDRKRCLEAGMNDYISKPIRISELAAALQRVQHWLQAQNQRLPLATSANLPHTSLTPAEALPPVDPDALREFAELMGEDGEAMVTELIGLYLAGTASLMTEFVQGVQAQALVTIQHAVHTLYSSSAQIGAHHLAALAMTLEQHCQRHDLPGIIASADTLVVEAERVLAYFNAVYAERTTLSPAHDDLRPLAAPLVLLPL